MLEPQLLEPQHSSGPVFEISVYSMMTSPLGPISPTPIVPASADVAMSSMDTQAIFALFQFMLTSKNCLPLKIYL